MSSSLEKGQKIKLVKDNGTPLTEFCVGCNWGAVVKNEGFLGLGRRVEEIDLDLSVVMFDKDGKMIDHIYSPLYRPDFLRRYNLPVGKHHSFDKAFSHSGDDRKGAENTESMDNEVISVRLTLASPVIKSAWFFLNNCGKEDFSQIPHTRLRIFEGTPSEAGKVFSTFVVSSNPTNKGATALVMGKLSRCDDGWEFTAIGDAYPDRNICETIGRISSDYAK
ncbi:MAG: tellurium resistance TerZ family protein [Muribaculaceae bacterium]|nr:tellurium resistance TerZ family protein [Muribaculaceae bacterium]